VPLRPSAPCGASNVTATKPHTWMSARNRPAHAHGDRLMREAWQEGKVDTTSPAATVNDHVHGFHAVVLTHRGHGPRWLRACMSAHAARPLIVADGRCVRRSPMLHLSDHCTRGPQEAEKVRHLGASVRTRTRTGGEEVALSAARRKKNEPQLVCTRATPWPHPLSQCCPVTNGCAGFSLLS